MLCALGSQILPVTNSGINVGGAILKSTIISGLLVDLYMAPTIVAAIRRHPDLLHVGVVNILTGWTIVGWIVAMVMACGRVSEPTIAERPSYNVGPTYPWQQEPTPPWPDQR